MDDDTTGRRASWQRRGFYRIDGFAGADVGDEMYDAALQIVQDGGRLDSGRNALVLPEANLASEVPKDAAGGTAKVFGLHRTAPFSDFVVRPDVASILIRLLGPDVDCFLSQLIFKNPAAWGQPWHQDSYYFPFEPARPIVGLWFAVTEATLENGCLHVLAGSHREPVHDHVPDRRPNANVGYVEIVDHDMSEAEPVLMNPGDLLVFDSHLMHRSTDNVSAGRRVAMVYHFAAAGTEDRYEQVNGYPSPVNDWVPVVRGGQSLADPSIVPDAEAAS